MNRADEMRTEAAVPALDGAIGSSPTRRARPALLSLVLSAYFWPTILAAENEHRQLEGIAGLNLLLGWTGLGWLAALAWARASSGPANRVARKRGCGPGVSSA